MYVDDVAELTKQAENTIYLVHKISERAVKMLQTKRIPPVLKNIQLNNRRCSSSSTVSSL